jgi:tRNA(Ile)-lysidine synthetase-like protein
VNSAVQKHEKQLLGRLRRALDDYNMVEDGDSVAIGLSGGKDSVALLYGLSRTKHFYTKKFSIKAITVDLGFEGFDTEKISRICSDMGVEHIVEKTLIGRIVFEERKEENPCALCANMRRGALNNAAVREGCNKVALAHNNDDVLETFLLSLLYEGRIHTLSPVTKLDRSGITVIRPLIYSPEKNIRAFLRGSGLDIVSNPCPANSKTARQNIRELITLLVNKNSDIRSNLFGAIKRANISGFKDS